MVVDKRLIRKRVRVQVGLRHESVLHEQLAVFKMPSEISRSEVERMGKSRAGRSEFAALFASGTLLGARRLLLMFEAIV